MDSELTRRQRKDEPAAAVVDVRKPEHVAKERARGLCVLGVEQRVRSGYHETVTQTRFPATVSVTGLFPTWIVFTTRSVFGSMRDTVPAREFATQTPPAPTAMP